MRGRGEGRPDATGGPAAHVPVLLAEVLDALDAARGGAFLDGTFGAGGYSAAILAANPGNRVVALDRDPTAIRGGAALVTESGGRLVLREACFGNLDRMADDALAGIVLDIGVSSMQLDRAERGFSFRQDGPLDMRMGGEGPSAADLVNGAAEAELADIIFHYGEERRSRSIARAIVERRRRSRIETTLDLADLVGRHVRAEPGLNPATRTFQAIRIAVNDELGELARALDAAERALAPGGRLVVVTFHSLEDRIVKRFMQARTSRLPRASRHLPSDGREVAPRFTPITRGPVVAGEAETARNPRARSAKLRAVERTEAPASPEAGGDALTERLQGALR